VIEIKALPKQDDFLSLSGVHNLLVSGYGFGKTETKLMALFLDMQMYGRYNPVFAVYDPTYDLLDLNTLPRLLERLDQFGISYKHNGSKKTIQTEKHGKIILRSMDTPNRIVAYESFRAYVDELETLRPKQVEDVWKKILGRNRQVLHGCESAQNRTYTFTTPDAGFGFTYKKWGQAKNKDRYQFIQASTRDNPHLPDGYIQTLEEDYPEAFAQAFIDGKWTNLKSGTVYSEFDRKKCHGKIEVNESDKLLIGQDFNVGGCVSVVAKLHNGILYILKTMVSKNTFDIYDNYTKLYSNKAVVYPDASGKNGSSNATETDIDILRKDFRIVVDDANPRISQRVLSLNIALKKGLVKIDTEEPSNTKLIEALEQQAYTDAGKPEKFNGSATIDDYNDAIGYLNFKINVIRRPAANISSVIQTG